MLRAAGTGNCPLTFVVRGPAAAQKVMRPCFWGSGMGTATATMAVFAEHVYAEDIQILITHPF